MTLLRWSSWFDLRSPGTAPALPGVYRIRRQGQEPLDYIGQTGEGGMTLRKRLAMLKGVFGANMPYRDPHTAGPGLWALRHHQGCDFEASVTVFEGATPDRKAQEAVVISLHRLAHLRSPTVNFGRMPLGYKMSSPNNAKLNAAGKVFRGGPAAAADDSHLPSLPPLIQTLLGPVGALGWGGHAWSPWRPLTATTSLGKGDEGLYRLRAANAGELLYVGEGLVRARLAAHSKKAGLLETAQGKVFLEAGALEASWVVNPKWRRHERLELENDLIAAHSLEVGHQPAGQFLG